MREELRLRILAKSSLQPALPLLRLRARLARARQTTTLVRLALVATTATVAQWNRPPRSRRLLHGTAIAVTRLRWHLRRSTVPILGVIVVRVILHNCSVVAVAVLILHCDVAVDGAVLAARVGAVRPGTCRIGAVRHTGVDSIAALMVIVLRVVRSAAVHLRLGLHATAVCARALLAVGIITLTTAVVATTSLREPIAVLSVVAA